MNATKFPDRKILINYANERYYRCQGKNSSTGINIGKFTQVIEYNPYDVMFARNTVTEENKDKNVTSDLFFGKTRVYTTSVFYEMNKKTINSKRGGMFIWKPLIIWKTLVDPILKITENDLVFYCDSGSYWIGDLQPYIDLWNTDPKYKSNDILCFHLDDKTTEKKYTKRDLLIEMNGDIPEILNSPQILGGFIGIRKTEKSMKVIWEWLSLVQVPRNINEDKSIVKDEYPEFISHKHDQSIFSLLIKLHNIIPMKDPSQYGNNINNILPQIIVCTRDSD